MKLPSLSLCGSGKPQNLPNLPHDDGADAQLASPTRSANSSLSGSYAFGSFFRSGSFRDRQGLMSSLTLGDECGASEGEQVCAHLRVAVLHGPKWLGLRPVVGSRSVLSSFAVD